MTDYQKLEVIYNEIDTLIAKRSVAESPDFESWHSKAERFLVNRSTMVFTSTRRRIFPIRCLYQWYMSPVRTIFA